MCIVGWLVTRTTHRRERERAMRYDELPCPNDHVDVYEEPDYSDYPETWSTDEGMEEAEMETRCPNDHVDVYEEPDVEDDCPF